MRINNLLFEVMLRLENGCQILYTVLGKNSALFRFLISNIKHQRIQNILGFFIMNMAKYGDVANIVLLIRLTIECID